MLQADQHHLSLRYQAPAHLATEPLLIHIPTLQRLEGGHPRDVLDVLPHCKVDFRKNDNLVPWQVEFLDRFPKNFLGLPIGVDIRCIERVDSSIVSTETRPSWVLGRVESKKKAMTYAALICFNASSSSKTQSCHFDEPYDMHPKMILLTLNPEFPRRTVNSHRRLSVKTSLRSLITSRKVRGLTVLH